MVLSEYLAHFAQLWHVAQASARPTRDRRTDGRGGAEDSGRVRAAGSPVGRGGSRDVRILHVLEVMASRPGRGVARRGVIVRGGCCRRRSDDQSQRRSAEHHREQWLFRVRGPFALWLRRAPSLLVLPAACVERMLNAPVSLAQAAHASQPRTSVSTSLSVCVSLSVYQILKPTHIVDL